MGISTGGILTAVASTAVLTACAPPDARLAALATQGEVQPNAPIIADATILISASPERVWGLISGVDRWPRWQPAIAQASLQGGLAPGRHFTWSSGGAQISSTLASVRPMSMIAWTGHAFGMKAVHVWTLSSQPGGRVRVRTRESMDGFPISLLYPSAKLQASDVAWLQSLKLAAETP